MQKKLIYSLLILIMLFSVSCATKTEKTTTQANLNASAEIVDFDNEDLYAVPVIPDPLESWNRFWFGFNDIVLLEMIKPVHQVYADIMPNKFQAGLSNFRHNLGFPSRFINSILQGKFAQAGVEMGRFMVNSTLGLGGLINVTKKDKPRVEVDPYGADFGQTLASWGVGEGFYFVLPLLGPSTLRDTIGNGVDVVIFTPLTSVPMFEAGSALSGLSTEITITSGGLMFNDAKKYYSPYEQVTAGAIEKYTAIRNAWVLNRRARLGY